MINIPSEEMDAPWVVAIGPHGFLALMKMCAWSDQRPKDPKARDGRIPDIMIGQFATKKVIASLLELGELRRIDGGYIVERFGTLCGRSEDKIRRQQQWSAYKRKARGEPPIPGVEFDRESTTESVGVHGGVHAESSVESSVESTESPRGVSASSPSPSPSPSPTPERERERPAGPTPKRPLAAHDIAAQLALAPKLHGQDLEQIAAQFEVMLETEPKADRLDRKQVGIELVAEVEAYAAKFQQATVETLVAQLGRRVTWILSDIRSGKRSTAPAAERPVSDVLRAARGNPEFSLEAFNAGRPKKTGGM